MRRVLGATAVCIFMSAGPVIAQERPSAKQEAAAGAKSSTPMDALAEAILAFAPEAHMKGNPTLASLRAKLSQIRWRPSPSPMDKDPATLGTLAGGTVTGPASDTLSELTFDWSGPEGKPFGFNPVEAFRKKGFKVQALYCAPMVSEGTNYFLVSAPGRRPGFLSIYAFDAPMAISLANWSISYRLDGYVPSLSEVQAKGDVEASTDCSSEVFGPTEQISYPAAVRFVQSAMSNSGAPALR